MVITFEGAAGEDEKDRKGEKLEKGFGLGGGVGFGEDWGFENEERVRIE